MQISPRLAPHLFIFLMVCWMTFSISLFLTIVRAGVDATFLGRWLENWVWSFAVALPSAFAGAPVIRRLLARMVHP